MFGDADTCQFSQQIKSSLGPGNSQQITAPEHSWTGLNRAGAAAVIPREQLGLLPFQGVQEVGDAVSEADVSHVQGPTHHPQHGVRPLSLKKGQAQSHLLQPQPHLNTQLQESAVSAPFLVHDQRSLKSSQCGSHVNPAQKPLFL